MFCIFFFRKCALFLLVNCLLLKYSITKVILLSSPELRAGLGSCHYTDTYQNCHSITAIEFTIYLVAGSVTAVTDGAPKNNQGGQGERPIRKSARQLCRVRDRQQSHRKVLKSGEGKQYFGLHNIPSDRVNLSFKIGGIPETPRF